MPDLPDPRRFAARSDNRLLRLVDDFLSAPESDMRSAHAKELQDALRTLLKAGSDAAIAEALRLAPSAAAYACLWQAQCAITDEPPLEADTVVTRVFALPCVIVCGARARTEVCGALPDAGALVAVLQQHGALGASRNVGISNALCGAEFLASIRPSVIYGWTRAGTREGVPRDIAPEDITVRPGREQVHVRYLLGACIAPVHAPAIVETAGNIGAWGVPFARALAAQLAGPGLDLLPLPRPPAGVLAAAYAGRRAQLEVALDLFASNTIRQFRATVGDPTVILSAHRCQGEDAEIRVSMSSPFDDTLLEGFRWPLHPLDEFERIVAGITGLLRECRVGDVRMVASVLRDDDRVGRPLFLNRADFERLAADSVRH